MCSESTSLVMGQNRGMGFAILRVQKLKSAVAVHRSMKHSFREQDTPNADAERRQENSHFGAVNVAEGMAAFRGRLPEKHRKDAVLAIEYLVTASPESMASKDRPGQDAYFADALAWLKAKHGAENVVHAGIHRDETTPHMYAYVVPRVGDKLNCRAFLGGAKALSAMQTDFAQRVGRPHGLERGLEGSKARHTTVQAYYARVNGVKAPAPPIRVPEPSMGDRINPKDYGLRVARQVLDVVEPELKQGAAARAELELQRKRVREVEETARATAKRYEPARQFVEHVYGQLDRADVPALNAAIREAGSKLVSERAARQKAARDAARSPATPRQVDAPSKVTARAPEPVKAPPARPEPEPDRGPER
jgi:hypothetical protein